MKKIMFSDKYGLTQAVLSGRKTMTRRIIPRDFFTLQWDEKGDTLWCEDDMGDFIDVRKTRYAQYKVGEVVAIAQSYKDAGYSEKEVFAGCPFSRAGWNNKLFIKSDLMPCHIRITCVKVERLQDISYEDCIKEGIFVGTSGITYHVMNLGICANTPREAYSALIDKVSGKGTWENNPWVFAYEFELVD